MNYQSGHAMKSSIDKTNKFGSRPQLSRGRAVLLLGLAVVLTGCATIKIPDDRTTGPGPATGLTGNWQFQITPTGGPGSFTSLAGFISETEGTPVDGDPVTAVFQATPATCFDGTEIIPLSGTVKTSQLDLRSFSIVGQFVTINATEDSTFSHLTGTYSIGGGCANGAAGTLSGVRYASLSGSYSGAITGSNPPKNISVALQQSSDGQGDGSFLVTGTAAFTGNPCFTRGTVTSPTSYIVGQSVSLTLTTDAPSNPQVVLTGTIDPAASTLSLSSIQVNGGSCPGSLGAASLPRSQ